MKAGEGRSADRISRQKGEDLMNRAIWRLTAVLALVLGVLTIASSYEAMVGPTGVLKYNAEKSYGGYTLFSPMVNSKTTYLIDMEGNMIHKWDTKYAPGA